MSLRLGYGTNGFGSHRLEDALAVIAGLGYDGVALTLDQPHLDPFDADLARRVSAVATRLDELGLAVMVETGARYVLDPWRKHEPTLVSDEGRERRVDLLRRAVEVGCDLGAEAVSFWSGTLPDGASTDEGWDRLTDGVAEVLESARTHDVMCAFEPEPGMFVDRLDGVLELRRRLGEPDLLGVTLDIGHIVCNEDDSITDVVERAGDLLANVQLDDMRRGVHEHLAFGDGEVDLAEAMAALEAVGFAGLASVELPRHGHAAPEVARRSLAALRAALPTHEEVPV
ncbi:MAG TPA: sugar phosphate isomerase/epimerase family protein [Nocardioidaceae bacterium]|nr:sugar phosphate isomerase/epimerase family protein [Nocardioidaceae bacterium]